MKTTRPDPRQKEEERKRIARASETMLELRRSAKVVTEIVAGIKDIPGCSEAALRGTLFAGELANAARNIETRLREHLCMKAGIKPKRR